MESTAKLSNNTEIARGVKQFPGSYFSQFHFPKVFPLQEKQATQQKATIIVRVAWSTGSSVRSHLTPAAEVYRYTRRPPVATERLTR